MRSSYLFLAVLSFLLNLFQPLHCEEVSSDPQSVTSHIYVDHVTTTHEGRYPQAKIFLSNGAHLLYDSDRFTQPMFSCLLEEMKPGTELTFYSHPAYQGIHIYVKDGSYAYEVGLGAGATEYFPKIVAIHKPGWFSWATKICLSDGSVWQYYSDLQKKWRVGDAVIKRSITKETFSLETHALINLHAISTDREIKVVPVSEPCPHPKG